MTDKKPTPDKKKSEKSISQYIPYALGLLILITAVIGAIQLIRWNEGQEFIIDEDVDVDSEPEDFVFFMDPAQLYGDQYDGTLDILILGNDTAAYDAGGTNIGEIIAEQTGANVYNCAFIGSYMSEHPLDEDLAEDDNESESDKRNPVDAFNFFWLSDSIQTGDWTRQETALAELPEGYDIEHYTEVLNVLKSIDYQKIDLLLIYYDGHDYLAKHPINDPTNMYSYHTIEGCFTGSYERYPINYPNMQHMFIAPTFCYVINEDGTKEGCDIADLGYGNLPTTLSILQAQTQEYSVSYLDNFYGITINAETADQYLLDDGITPNDKGREMIANRIVDFINRRIK